MNRCAILIILLAMTLVPTSSRADAEFDLGTATLTLNDRGVAGLAFADGSNWPAQGPSAFALKQDGKTLAARLVRQDGNQLIVTFDGGVTAEFQVDVHPGVAVFRLTELSAPGGIAQLQLFRLGLPESAQTRRALNAATHEGNFAAVMACELNVHAFQNRSRSPRADRAGGRHEFELTDEAKSGESAARFAATSNAEPGGWSMRGRLYDPPLDLTGLTAIRAWVHGDGQGQSLKFQFSDGQGGNRDTYLPINFKGWRQITLTEHPYDNLQYNHVTGLNLYYNGLPPDRTVTCLIDRIEAIVERDGRREVILLEDFETQSAPRWNMTQSALCVETLDHHGIEPAAFAVLACPEAEFMEIMPRVEKAAGLPSPHPGGVWNKRSPWVDHSYLFLTRFDVSQFDEALALARQGDFQMILLGQSSWCESTGHYGINRKNFPDGLEDLKRTIDRFHDAGFHVGLHLLGASIDSDDPYLTPVPDPRLVKDASATLAANIDAKADFLPIESLPEDFPEEDGSYRGEGTVIQIGEELIQYGSLSKTPPYGFRDCTRGYLGTKAAPHGQGETVRHLDRSFGYFMFDMDTSLLDEVTANLADVANACDVDMIYFDGSERLQGDHWYYNAKLHKAVYDKLDNKNMLFQASSFSHYSWHMLARSASADGHGDLKGYLEERSPAFAYFARNGMPLDIGWYYGYDPESTIDQYEYVLRATIGYESSMSFQVSVDAAANHPFTTQILDKIAHYEQLRLSGRVSPEMRALVRIDPALSGKDAEQRAQALSHRRDYRLLGESGEEVFQRVIYTPWRELGGDDANVPEWTIDVPQHSRVGFQVHLRPGPRLAAGPSYDAEEAVLLESFDDLAPFTSDPEDQQVSSIESGESGTVLPGVAQRLDLREGGRQGSHFAAYTAESTLKDNTGWSVMRRTFNPPLDLSAHRAIGLWLRGDGQGGKFKLQLLDGKGAMDYYINNDYEGWRYHQLERPKTDAINYQTVRNLLVYYNGIPGQTKITCGIDGIKALPRIDRQTLKDPWIKVGEQRLEATATLGAGEYLFVWPGEPVKIYSPSPEEPATSAERFKTVELPPGTYQIQYGHTGGPKASLRVRLTLQTPERHVVPK